MLHIYIYDISHLRVNPRHEDAVGGSEGTVHADITDVGINVAGYQ